MCCNIVIILSACCQSGLFIRLKSLKHHSAASGVSNISSFCIKSGEFYSDLIIWFHSLTCPTPCRCQWNSDSGLCCTEVERCLTRLRLASVQAAWSRSSARLSSELQSLTYIIFLEQSRWHHPWHLCYHTEYAIRSSAWELVTLLFHNCDLADDAIRSSGGGSMISSRPLLCL